MATQDKKKEHIVNGKLSRHGALGVAALLVAALVLPGALAAETPAQRAVATVYSGGVDFLPNVDFSRAVVTVSGNGISFSRAFYPGERLSIGMFDPEGQPLADGVYSWQLELQPTAEAAWDLKVSASENGGVAPGAWTPQSGSFAIRDGLVADPDLIEPGAWRTNDGLPNIVDGAAAPVSREDTDEAVGWREGAEQSARNAAQAAQAPAPAAGLMQPGREDDMERSDAAAMARGASLETLIREANQAARPAAAPPAQRAASPDGAHGRPRSEDR